MSREIKRVPLDFDWPLDERWHGFVNPWYGEEFKCAACKGRGTSPQGEQLEEYVRMLFLAAQASKERPNDYVPPPHPEMPWRLTRMLLVEEMLLTDDFTSDGLITAHKKLSETHANMPSLAAVFACLRELSNGVDPDARRIESKSWPFEQDPVEVLSMLAGGRTVSETDAWIIRRIGRLVPSEHTYAPRHYSYQWKRIPGQRAQRILVPESPVFETPEELAQWLHEHDGAGHEPGLSVAQWLNVVNAGCVPFSMVGFSDEDGVPIGLMSGVRYVGSKEG